MYFNRPAFVCVTRIASFVVLLILPSVLAADKADAKETLRLSPGEAQLLSAPGNRSGWSCSDEKIVQVFPNGLVVGLRSGIANVWTTGADTRRQWQVSVHPEQPVFRDPATIQQYEDQRVFRVNGRKGVGRSEERRVGKESRSRWAP